MTKEIEETLQVIFSGILIGGSDKETIKRKQNTYRECVSIFNSIFTYNIFKDEYAFLYDVYSKLNIKAFTLNQLELIIDNNTDIIIKSPIINLDQWDNITIGNKLNQEEKILLFKKNVLNKYKSLSGIIVSTEQFQSACKIFIDYYVEETSLLIAQQMTMITKEGIKLQTLDGKLRTYKGAEGRSKFFFEQHRILESLKGIDGIQDTVINEEWLQNDLREEEEGEEEALLTSNLSPIDNVTGPLRRSNVLGILGPPKGGKTKYANYYTTLALEAGLNVAVWVLEGTQKEWIAMQTASYIRMHQGDSLNSNDILSRKYESPAQRQQVIAAKTMIALNSNNKRGRLSFIEGTAYVENFIETILTHYRCKNPFDVLVIDSLVNIQSLTGRNKVDRISEGFMATKDLVAHKLPVPALAILTAQLKQSTIDWLRSHPDETMDVTAGGESAETIRTPDIIHGLFSTKDERKENEMHIYCVGARHSEAFDDFKARCELNCAYFEYIE